MQDTSTILHNSTEYSYDWDNDNSTFPPAICYFYDTKKIVITFYSLAFVLGFLGNGLVVCVLVKHRKQSNLTDICLFNLALADLLFVISLPFYGHAIMTGKWTYGNFMCHFLSGLHRTSFFSSIIFMVIMTLDRYLVIIYALKVTRYRTLRASIALTIVSWILSFSISLPSFLFTRVVNETEKCHFFPQNKNWDYYDMFSTNVIGLIIPLLVMVGCYSRIIPRLVNMRTAKKHRIVKLIIAIVLIFFLFWSPYNISLFLKFLNSNEIAPSVSTCSTEYRNILLSVSVAEAFAYTHCCLNPIIYALVGQRFMKRTIQMFKAWVPFSSRSWTDASSRGSSFMSRSSVISTVV